MEKVKILFIIFFCVSCSDSPLIYKSNSTLGLNTELRFDGYYAQINPNNGYVSHSYFFYNNGTMIYLPKFENQARLENKLEETSELDWGWSHEGNFQIKDDKLMAEFWVRNSGDFHKYRRIFEFRIDPQNLVLLTTKFGNNEIINVENENLVFEFYPNDKKPISETNWIREKRRWNR